MVDTRDLKSLASDKGRAGSSPASGTFYTNYVKQTNRKY